MTFWLVTSLTKSCQINFDKTQKTVFERLRCVTVTGNNSILVVTGS